MNVEEVTIGQCRLIRGDCREVLPTLGQVDAVVTDPVYPDTPKDFYLTPIDCLNTLACRQFVFWSATEDFPLTWTAIHIWHKPNGRSSAHYERIFERHGTHTCRVWTYAAILPNYVQYQHECVDHPTQKPLRLLRQIICQYVCQNAVCLDPFMGSGTTGIACLQLGRSFIGVEIEPRYFDLACRRIEAAYAQLDLMQPATWRPPQQLTLTGGTV